MFARLALLAVLGLALCGPSPFRGAAELRDLLSRRYQEWNIFYQQARLVWEQASKRIDEANNIKLARK